MEIKDLFSNLMMVIKKKIRTIVLKEMANGDDKFCTSIIGVNVVMGTTLPSRNPIILVLG